MDMHWAGQRCCRRDCDCPRLDEAHRSQSASDQLRISSSNIANESAWRLEIHPQLTRHQGLETLWTSLALTVQDRRRANSAPPLNTCDGPVALSLSFSRPEHAFLLSARLPFFLLPTHLSFILSLACPPLASKLCSAFDTLSVLPKPRSISTLQHCSKCSECSCWRDC